MQKRLPIGVKKIGEVLPKLGKEELWKRWRAFEKEQEIELDKILIEQGIKKA